MAMPASFGLIVRWHLFPSFVSCVSCPCMFRLCPFICLAALLAEVVLDLWPFLPSALLFCASVYICVPIWVVSVLWSILVEFLPLCQPVGWAK